MQTIHRLFTLVLLSFATFAMADTTNEEKLWQETYNSRQAYFEKTVGPLPQDILKMLSMSGVWPGGGLFVVPAAKVGPELAVYTTFGFTNPDMPTRVRMSGFKLDSDGNRATRGAGTLQGKEPAPQKAGAAGYGYEILVVTRKGAEWPLAFLQWAVNAEIGGDAGLLARAQKYDGLTVEQIDVGREGPINVLISMAQAPLPTGTSLPNGRMELLVATVITIEEMSWSMKNGRGALLKKLRDSGIGQVSVLGRKSVVP
jgi:hypothetical protein